MAKSNRKNKRGQEIIELDLLVRHKKGKPLSYGENRFLRERGLVDPIPNYNYGKRGRPAYDYVLTPRGFQKLKAARSYPRRKLEASI